MQIVESPKIMQAISNELLKKGKTIGFVPTMGALHEGHYSLIRTARKENDVVICSIFVNPTQFGPNEDFDRYPKAFAEDSAGLERERTDFLFYPKASDMYPEGYETYISLENLPGHLCGLSRPIHFRGVATVVMKFFNIIKPTVSYFGQKDYQQATVIKKMVSDLNMETQVSVIPIVREPDGLAMSSRNKYLSDKERKESAILYQTLQLAGKRVKEGLVKSSELTYEMEENIKRSAPAAKIDYISIVHPDTLEDLQEISGKSVIALAVYFGSTRLIDNIIIDTSTSPV